MTTFISSALANLVNTESPSLRHQIQYLGNDAAQEIRRRVVSLVLRSARVPKIQIQEQRTSYYQSLIESDYVVENDEPRDSKNLQEIMEEQEQQGLSEIREDGRQHDGSSFHSENNMDPHFGDLDLNYEQILRIYHDSDINEESGLEYGLPSSGSPSSTRQVMPDHLEDPDGYDNIKRLTGHFSKEKIPFGPQGGIDQEIRGDLVTDDIDEVYIDDDIEDPVWSTHHNLQVKVPFHDYNWQESVIGMHVYGGDIRIGHGHQVHLDAEPDSEPGLPSRPRFLDPDEAEGARDEYSDRDYWAEQNLTMVPENFFMPREADHSQLGFHDHLMEDHCDTDSLDCAMDESTGEFGEVLFYDDAYKHLTEVLTDEDADLGTQQEALDEEERVDGDLFGSSSNGDFGRGKGAFMLCGETASRPFTSASHHSLHPESVFDEKSSQMTGMPLHPCWTASNHCTGSTSAYA